MSANVKRCIVETEYGTNEWLEVDGKPWRHDFSPSSLMGAVALGELTADEVLDIVNKSARQRWAKSSP